MRIHYDGAADALYVRLDDSKVIDSQEVRPGIIFDFDSRKQVVGIEILGFKSNLPDANLKELEFKIA